MTQITVLIENEPVPGLAFEHGLSMLIRHYEDLYLMDTGASAAFLHNVRRLGLDLTGLSKVLLTHAHRDHTGGLAAMLARFPDVKVYMRPGVRGSFYSLRGGVQQYIGMDKSLLSAYPGNFVDVEPPFEVGSGVHLCSDTVGDATYLCRDTGLMAKKDGELVPDVFEHELFTVIEDKGRLAVLSSCSHRGIVNILRTVKKLWPSKEIALVAGGIHLKGSPAGLNCSVDFVREVASQVGALCDGLFYIGHCTGTQAFEIMRETLGDRVRPLRTGDTIRM